MADIFCIGSAHIDKILTFYQKPIMGCSNPASSDITFGGVVQNIAFTLNDLGNELSMVSFLGTDTESEQVLGNLKKQNIKTTEIIRTSNHATASYTAFHKEDGELYISTADMDIYDYLTPDMINKVLPVITKGKTWIFDTSFSVEVQNYLVNHIKDINVYVTVSSLPKAYRIKPLLPKTTALFGNVDEMNNLADNFDASVAGIKKSLEIIASKGTKSIFATCGEKGVYVWHDKKFMHFKALPVNIKCVNGAGDAFAAGTMNGMIKGECLEDAVHAGLKCAVARLEGVEITDAVYA